ncbi:cupin domain-containing protein [Halorientalis halophila]|uniref:cupin domain-containing protein n=1 Tax=Halorientalis halophila TaxID=3108499 RepID=UPI003009BDD8
MAEEFAIVDAGEIGTEPFPISGVEHAKLTELLGAEDMRVNALILEPDDVVDYHTHERQEEIYVCTKGPGQVYIDGDLHEVPEGGVVRVGAAVPRQLLNTTESATHRWVMFGAPPVGTVEEFGEYVRSDGGYGSETE